MQKRGASIINYQPINKNYELTTHLFENFYASITAWSYAFLRAKRVSLILGLLVFGVFVHAQDTQELFKVEATTKGGFYSEPVAVNLVAPSDAVIYFTTDGSVPTETAKIYTKPLLIQSSVVLRAVAYRNFIRSKEWVATYFIQEPSTKFATISLAIDPVILFDPDFGLFMDGSSAIDSIWSKPGANFWSRDEFPMHLEIFEADKTCIFSSDAGFRLFGGFSRLFPQKSLTLITRESYGESRINYPIFGANGADKFKFLVLRNSGSDFGKSHFRDALMTSLVENWDVETQDYRPAHVYINGDYWGIYNIREKINRYFIEAHSKTKRDSIDLMEHRDVLKLGSRLHYVHLLNFLERSPMVIEGNYEYVQSLMDVDNFMDYQIAQIYFDNQDAGGNIKFWRPRRPDGRWRWILFDTDWGFGLHDSYAYKNNSLAFHTDINEKEWPNPAWSTFILRKLLENPTFKSTFVNRFADYLNSDFEAQRVTSQIDSFYQLLKEEMPRHFERWNLSATVWEKQVALMKTFAEARPEHVRMHLMDMFETGNQVNVDLKSTQGGKIQLNRHIEVTNSFSGIYFENYPIHLAAIPHYGYRFSHWEGLPDDLSATNTSDLPASSQLQRFTLPLHQRNLTLKAVFEPFQHPLIDQVVVNEISMNNKQSGDWIEIFNRSNVRVDLSGWMIGDTKHEFTLPQVTIGPKDYLVICQDSAKFFKVFPNAYNVVSGLSFGLNKHEEHLQLFTNDGAMIDSLHYQLPPSDSSTVLSLLLPNLNNANMDNWSIRQNVGTPNAGNPYYIESKIRQEQQLWMQVGAACSMILICILLLVWKRQQHVRLKMLK